HGAGAIGSRGPVLADIGKTLTAGLPSGVDPARDAECREQSLHSLQQPPRRGAQPDVPALLAVIDTAICVEQTSEERGHGVRWRLLDCPGHDLLASLCVTHAQCFEESSDYTPALA